MTPRRSGLGVLTPPLPRRPIHVGLAVLAALLAAAVFGSVYDLRTDQEALVLRFGRPLEALNTTDTADSGLHLKAPIVDRVIRFDRRLQDLRADPIEAITADGRPVIVDAFLDYRIRQPLTLVQTAGDVRSAGDRLALMLKAAVRQTVARIGYAPLVAGDATSLETVRAALNDQAGADGLGVEVVDLGLSHIDPTPPQVQAIVHRMQADATAAAAAIRATGEHQKQLLIAEADKESNLIRAEAIGQGEDIWGAGDAGRADILAKAYGKDPSFAHFYQAMRAYEGALGDKQTTLILSPTSDFFQAFQKAPSAR